MAWRTFFIICDGLKGLPDSVGAAFPQARVQTCVIHLISGTRSSTPRRSTGARSPPTKPVYRAPTREAAWAAFEEFEEKWGKPYPAIGQLWRNAWEQFVPFLDYRACRRIACRPARLVFGSAIMSCGQVLSSRAA